ncbi:hypothetical protein ONZ45_g10687 [Pleurotus djamor]|nr:hypothetical protein ONZ45_g10687 [Pleurotus djamor]
MPRVNIKDILRTYQLTPIDTVKSLLLSDDGEAKELFDNLAEPLMELMERRVARAKLVAWAGPYMLKTYKEEVSVVSSQRAGFHFGASKATEEKIRDYQLDNAIQQVSSGAPLLWELLSTLLSSDEEVVRQRKVMARRRKKKRAKKRRQRRSEGGGSATDSDSAAMVIDGDDGEGGEASGNTDGNGEEGESLLDSEDEAEDEIDRAEKRQEGLNDIRTLVCLSIIMKSSNSRCNAFQTLVGVFLHATVAPESVREFLSSIGLSISTTSIHNAVTSLAGNAEGAMKTLGSSLLTLFAYDNLDMDLKRSVPTAENTQETQVHLTTGTMLPLHPMVTREDLDCSEHLWNTCRHDNSPSVPMEKLIELHAKPRDAQGLLPRDRFRVWKFISDLLHHGPEEFKKHLGNLTAPETYEAIPMHKTTQVPNRTLDIAPSGPIENAQAIKALLTQAGIGDPAERRVQTDIGNSVILVSGDLLTGERIRSVLESRAVEQTPWRRLQFVVYVMGLFHLKMACADAIWRIFISKKDSKAEDDETSMMEYIRQIRPKESLKFANKPGFRRTHEAIEHIGIVLRLDSWRAAVAEEHPECESLEDWATKEPSWEDIVRVATKLGKMDATTNDIDSTMRLADDEARDIQYENNLLRHHYFLLYEEISYAMNHGDIGRVEACFLPWMNIFAGCGKHKYAAELRRYLEDVHFRYPAGIKKAIRPNILINLTGKEGKWRGIDWLVEHNNLYIKVSTHTLDGKDTQRDDQQRIYGGKYSNHTKAHIIKESQLIEVYKNTRIQFEQMFCLDHKTTRHSPPNMRETFQQLGRQMKRDKVNVFQARRQSKNEISDYEGLGFEIMMRKLGKLESEVEVEAEAEATTADDAELEDDGGIDM